MITEVIVAKGLLAIGHWAVVHATAGTVALAVKTVAGMTLAQFLTTTVTAGFVAGCVVWSRDRINNVTQAVKYIDNGDYSSAAKEFAAFAMSANVDVEMLPDVVEEGLNKMGLSTEESRKIAKWVKTHENQIAKYK